MIVPKIAFRNIFRQRRRSILTGLTMTGGFVLLSFAFSISEGTYSRVIDLFTRSYTGHVQIHREDYVDEPSLHKTIDNLSYLAKKIEGVKGVASWAPRVFSPSLAFIEKKTTVARIIGIDPVRERKTTKITEKLAKGRFISDRPSMEIIIGGGLAEILDAKIGDEIVLIAQGGDGSIANDVFEVTGIMRGGGGSTDRINCYMHIKTAQDFLTLPDRYHEIALVMDDYEKSRPGAKLIAAAIDDPMIDVQPWETIQKQFYRAMTTDKKGMWIGLSIIMAIVAIGVLNTVLMTILERTKEFGILRAMGTRSKSILSLIVLESLLLSVLSIILGCCLSLIINYIFSIHGIDYPSPVEMGGFVISTMYGTVIPIVFLIPAAVTFLTAFLVSLPPAVRAMRITPVKAMRTV